MFKQIIWATDGSEIADGALEVAEEIARTHRAKIIAFHATLLFEGGRYNGGSLAAGDDELQLKIRSQVEGMRAQGYESELILVTSGFEDVPHLIANAAEEHQADLIVLGTHGMGVLPGLLFGGVAKRLLRLASCPVLVVPPRTRVRAGASGAWSRPRSAVHAGSQDVSSL